MADKIIHSFQDRRRLAQAFEALAQTETEQELMEQVRVLTRAFSSDLLLAHLIRNLDTPSSQLRGGLGHLAALLPADETEAALRSAAANRQHSAQTRLTAALLAERFLGRPLPTALLNDLAGSDDAAFQSLVEAIEEGKHNRHVLLEYVLQMREMGQDIAFLVMDALDRLPGAERPALLRLIAHDTRATVAGRAIDRLVLLTEPHAPDDVESRDNAAYALHVLEHTLPPQLAEPITRANRKLRFAGHGYTPPQAQEWHGLLSPADMGGNQTIWCFRRPQDGQNGALLGLVVNSRLGIIQAFGSETIDPEHLPQTTAVGQMTLVKTDGGENAVLLEAPFDFCRARIAAALHAHWKMEPKRELPPEYQLYNDLIWQFAPPSIEPNLARFFAEPPQPNPESADVADSTQPANPDRVKNSAQGLDGPTPEEPQPLDVVAAELLQHPAMAHWRVQNRMLQQLLRRARPLADSRSENPEADPRAADENAGSTAGFISTDGLIALVLRELASRPETAQINEAMIAGLQAQAAWLEIAGDSKAAAQAHRLAQALPQRKPQENPLLAHMIAAGIEKDD